MRRTSIMLPLNLKNRARLFASKRGISLGELIRESLEDKLNIDKNIQKSDSFFEDNHFYHGDVPKDLSAKHDEYLNEYIY
jgi:hypothetical protein